MRCAILLSGLLLSLALPARADVVEFTDGTCLEGKVVRETKDRVTLLTKKRKKKVFSRSKVVRIRKGWTIYDAYRDRLTRVGPRGAAFHVAVAAWCEKNKLKGLATLHWRRAVAADPACEEAHRKLGHVAHDGQWYKTQEAANRAKGLTNVRGRWVAAAEVPDATAGFKKHGGDWFTAEELARLNDGKAVETAGPEGWNTIRTLHYRLFTQLTPAKSRKFADMAEQSFAAFETLFGFAPKGVLEGTVFGTLARFKDYVVGRGLSGPEKLYTHGFFDGVTARVIFPYIDDDYTSVNILLHELCHQFEVMGSQGGMAPIWFYEGIATVVAHHTWIRSKLTMSKLNKKKNFNLYYFQHTVRTGKARTLPQVLRGSPGAKIDPVFYNHAWGLTWFLMHCDGYADKFPAYLRYLHSPEARGKDAVEAFKERFGPLDKVERDWLQYIKSIKGLRWRGKGREAGSGK